MPVYVATIEAWQRVALLYAAIMGIEAGILLGLTYTRRRPWYEEALASVPLGILIWALFIVRSTQQTLADLRAYEMAHSSQPEFALATLRDVPPIVDATARTGWALIGISTTMLVAGLLLVLSWRLTRRQLAGKPRGRIVHTAHAPVRAPTHAQRPRRELADNPEKRLPTDDLEKAFRDWD